MKNSFTDKRKYSEQLVSIGNFKKLLKDLNGAFRCYDEAINLFPGYAIAYYKRGNLKYLLNDIPGALEDFNKAIKLKPKLAEAFNNRGIIKYNSGDSNGSKKDFIKAARLGYYNAFESKKEFCR